MSLLSPDDDSENSEDIPDDNKEVTEDIMESNDDSVTQNNFVFSIGGEEEHLEYFYIASFLFLAFLCVILIKQNIETSRKKAVLVQKLQKLKLEQNKVAAGQAVLRQISLH